MELKNGIPVLYRRIPGATRYALFLGITAGAAHEPEDKLGIAHLTEHMVFTTNGAFNSQQLVKMLEWHGIDTNASTSFGLVKVFLHGPTQYLSYGAEILLKMATNHDYTEQEFQKEQQIVIEELKTYRNLPSEYLSCWILEPNLLHGSKLSRNILGTEETLQKISLSDVKQWKSSTFIPENFILSIAGDIDQATACEILNSTFGNLPVAKTTQTFAKQMATPKIGAYRETRAGIDQTFVHRGYLAPSMSDEEYPVALLLNYILDGGMSSRCFQEMREKRSLGYSSGYKYIKEYGYCYFYLDGCVPERADEVAEAFNTIIEGLNEISTEELEGMRTLVLAHIDDKLRQEDEVARKILDTFAYRSSFTYEKIRQELPKITIEHIQALARKMFTKEFVEARLYPENE